MLLKNFFFCFYQLFYNLSLYLVVSFIFLNKLYILGKLEVKLYLLPPIIMLVSIWGFLHSLDGILIIFLITEFSLFILLIVSYFQVFSNFKFLLKYKPIKYKFLIFIISVFISLASQVNVFSFLNYYNYLFYFLSSDFFSIYHFLFESLNFITTCTILMISFVSLFFILVYYNLKFLKNKEYRDRKFLFLLRKQVLVKQVKFSSKVYTFQK